MSAPATFFCIVGNNDTSWRVDVPAKALGAKVVKVPMEVAQSQFTNPNLDGDFRWYLSKDDDPVYPDLEGTAVWTRPDTLRATHAIAMYDQGARMVAEVDDNYLAPPKHNLFMRQHYHQRSRDEIRKAYATFEHIIVTTDWLAEVYRRELKGIMRGYKLPHFHVCGNHVDPDDWPEAEDYDGPLRIGWMGSDSHWRDVWLAYSALGWASKSGHRAIFIGYDPKWWPQCSIKSGRIPARTEYGFTFEHIPWVDPREWKRKAFPLDIALAPLEANKFTRCKSDVKVLEYGMAGAAVVASRVIYGKTIRHGETGLIARDAAEMLKHTQALARDSKMRAELAANLTQYVREERLITQPKNLNPWREAIGA